MVTAVEFKNPYCLEKSPHSNKQGLKSVDVTLLRLHQQGIVPHKRHNLRTNRG